jgi:1,4-alpha-glucan branching enzyme
VQFHPGAARREALNTDAACYGGTNGGNLGGVEAVAVPACGLPFSAEVALPPLGTIFLVPASWCETGGMSHA